jgi:hypothetical protein
MIPGIVLVIGAGLATCDTRHFDDPLLGLTDLGTT